MSKPTACHQIIFSYIVYNCYSFLNVRIYEADILDAKSIMVSQTIIWTLQLGALLMRECVFDFAIFGPRL